MFKDNKNFQYLTGGSMPAQQRGTAYAQQRAPVNLAAGRPPPAKAYIKPVPVGSPPPPKNKGQKNRVRVGGAGDKCVPPSKSRPKKRGGVTDGSSLSMDNVTWSDERYTTSLLVDKMHTMFPLIVKVTEGYMGEYGAELSMDQVLQIHSCGWQTRVFAQTTGGRGLSLPLNHRMNVLPMQGPQSGEISLQDAMRMYVPPFRAQVMSMSADPDISPVNLTGEEVMFERQDNEVYLRANSINEGWLDQTDVMCIPAFLGAEFAVAVGMQGATEAEWSDYKNMFSRSIRHLNFNLLQGYTNVVVTSCSAEGGFRYSYYDNKPAVSQPRPRTPVQQPKPPPYTPPPKYIRPQSPTGTDTTASTGSTKKLLPSPSEEAHFESEVVVHAPHRRDEPEAEEPVVIRDAVYENLITRGRNEAVTYENVVRDDTEVAPPIPPRQPITGQHSIVPTPQVPPQSRPETPFSEVDENDVEDMFARVIQVAHEQEVKQSTLQLSTRNNAQRENTLGAPAHFYSGQNESRPNQQAPKKEYIQMDDRTPPRNQSRNIRPHSETDRNNEPPSDQPRNSGAYRSFQAPRAIVQPQIQRVRSDHIPTANKPGINSTIHTMEDVPAQLDSLSVEDVCQCLRMLNMDGHITGFRSHQIDGKLLASMKESVLINDFKFTDFNASKMMRFTRGWRPKLA